MLKRIILQIGSQLFLSEFGNWDVWLAVLELGFSSAIRIAAPIIGILVLASVLLSRRLQVLLINYLDHGWLITSLGRPNAEKAIETVLPGTLVPAWLDDNDPS